MPDQSSAATPESEGLEPEAEAAVDGAESEDSAPVFMNRAARRANAQGAKPRRSAGSNGQFGRRGTVQGPRQWGNRRSG